MEKQHISNTKLDDFFALARDMKPIAGIDELESQIQNAGVGAHKSLFHNLKFKIVMSTSIIVIAAYITSLFFSKENKHNNLVNHNPENQLLLKKERGEKNQKNKLFESKKKIALFKLKPSTNAKPLSSILANSDASDILSYLPGIIPLELDKDQLEKLGFETDENNKVIIYKTGIDGLGTMYYSNGNGESTLKINSKGFILNKIRDYYPVFISDGTSSTPLDIDASFRIENKFMWRDSLINWNLVPVLIKQSEFGAFEGHKDLIFWFKSTPALLSDLKGVNYDRFSFVKLLKMDNAISELKAATQPYTTSLADTTPVTPRKIYDNQDNSHTLKFALDETPSVSTNFSGNKSQIKLSRPELKTTSFLTLDKKHLAKMGFSTNLKAIDYRAKIIGIGNMYCYYHGSESKFGFNDSTMQITNTYTFYPVYISDKHGRSPDDGSVDPVDVDYITGRSQLNLAVKQHPKDDMVPVTIRFAKHGYNLIPVLFKSTDFEGFPLRKDIVFWFKETAELDSILNDIPKSNIPLLQVTPDEIAQKQINAIIGDKHFTLHPNMGDNQIAPAALQGIKFLELDQKYLEKLGFIFKKDELSYNGNLPWQGRLVYTDNKKDVSLSIGSKLLFIGKKHDFYPVFISDRNGIQFFKYRNNLFESKDKWTDAYFLATIRKLVPVVVKQNIPGLADQKDLVFWFNVTPSFLALLPDTISKDMGKEYHKLVSSESKTPDTTTVTTCKYFDVCQVPLEQEYGVKIYPNPAQDKINLEFWPPKNDGTIYTTIELTDLNGKIIQKNESPWYGRTAEMQLDNVKPGIYLVVYKLSTGEVITNKVMITR